MTHSVFDTRQAVPCVGFKYKSLLKVPLDKMLNEKGQELERFSLTSRRSRYTQNIAIARNTSVMILEIDLCIYNNEWKSNLRGVN